MGKRKVKLSLRGRVVFVTGAARGIGAATARHAVARGAKVALVGLEPEKLAELAAELGDSAMWVEADVTDQAALDRAAEEVTAHLGGIDVVVANAGVASLGTIPVTPVEDIVKVIEVNLVGVIRTVKATLPRVIERRGHVLVVSSAAAFTALPGLTPYMASKAGAEQFANGLRLEVDHRGVSVGSAHMVWIDTDMVRDTSDDLPSFKEALGRMPGALGSYTSVDDCAEAFIAGIEGRKRRVYVPRSLAAYQFARSLIISAGSEAVIKAQGRKAVPRMEAEVQALGRSFGTHAEAALHGEG